MPQPASVGRAATAHVGDFDEADEHIRRSIARVFSRRRGAARAVTVAVRDATRRLEETAVGWARGELAGIYRLGVRVASDVTGLSALEELMSAEIADLAAEHVDDVVELGAGLRRGAAGFVVPDGLPVLTPGEVRALSPMDLRDLLEHPIGLVRYSDGSYRTVADHGDMLVRTRAATVYNRGVVDLARQNGVGWVETFDGPDCGWTAHTDGSIANGAIVETEFAGVHLLAHPRCQRSFRPRPDIDSARRAAKATPLGLPFDDATNPLPLPGPTVQPRPRVQRRRASRAARARRARAR